MIKKIIILTLLALFPGMQVQSACPIKAMGSCTASVQSQDQTINDKLLPNNLDQLVNPSKSNGAQPHPSMPESINFGAENNNSTNQENVTPYNASCQFGFCPSGETNIETQIP